MCQSRAGDQLCPMKLSGEAGKQGCSVLHNNAFRGYVALPCQTEGEKEWIFIGKDFLLSKDTEVAPIIFAQVPMGKNQWHQATSKTGTCHLSPGTIRKSRKKETWVGKGGQILKKRDLVFRYFIKVVLSPPFQLKHTVTWYTVTIPPLYHGLFEARTDRELSTYKVISKCLGHEWL